MEAKKLFIPLLLGTRRRERQSEQVAKLIFERASAHPEIESQLFDTRNMDFSSGDEGEDLKEYNIDYRDAIIRADGLIIVSPEYNHGYPGSLKMTLDMLLKEYIHKAVGICGVSSGNFGGARMIEALVNTVRELGLVVTFEDLYFPRVQESFDEHGKPKDEKVFDRIDGFLKELVWMANVLRWGREHLK